MTLKARQLAFLERRHSFHNFIQKPGFLHAMRDVTPLSNAFVLDWLSIKATSLKISTRTGATFSLKKIIKPFKGIFPQNLIIMWHNRRDWGVFPSTVLDWAQLSSDIDGRSENYELVPPTKRHASTHPHHTNMYVREAFV